jgi:CRP/FNR family transcriptional regulator, cyclic AMP receptor protein
MVSPELIRRFPFFSNFTMEQIVFLAKIADESTVRKDHYFFNEGDELNYLYIIVEGEVAVITLLPPKGREVILDSQGIGDIFGWSAFVPPHASTAGAKAVTSARVIAFDAKELRKKCDEDCQFGYLMMTKIAQVIRERLIALRIETLAYSAG